MPDILNLIINMKLNKKIRQEFNRTSSLRMSIRLNKRTNSSVENAKSKRQSCSKELSHYLLTNACTSSSVGNSQFKDRKSSSITVHGKYSVRPSMVTRQSTSITKIGSRCSSIFAENSEYLMASKKSSAIKKNVKNPSGQKFFNLDDSVPNLNTRRFSLVTNNVSNVYNSRTRRSSIGTVETVSNNQYFLNKKRQDFAKSRKRNSGNRRFSAICDSDTMILSKKESWNVGTGKIKIMIGDETKIINISEGVINFDFKKCTKIRRHSKCCIEPFQHSLTKRRISI